MYYKLTIDETARNNPKLDVDEDTRFNQIVETFKTLDDVKGYLQSRYSGIPKRTRNIFSDSHSDKPIGFLHSFWNKDWSHNSKSWWQTDWIIITEVNENYVLIN